MVYGPAPPKGSRRVNGRTIVPPRRFKGPVRPGTDIEHFRRTGETRPRGGNGGGFSASDRARQSAADLAAQAAALKLAQQKAQDEAAARLADARAKQELNRITSIQQRIIRDRGRVTQKKSRDAATGNILNITEYTKNGTKVRRVYDTKTGQITFNAYAPGVGGGATRRVGGVTLGGTQKKQPVTHQLPKDFTKKINVTLSNDVKNMINNQKMSSSINKVMRFSQVNATIQNDVKMGRVSLFLIDIADVVSGGYVTEKKINADQASLNDRIIKFNNRYNGRELSESEYKKAVSEERFIESEQKRLNTRIDNLVSSKKNKVRNFYQSLSIQKTPRLTVSQHQEVVKARSENIKIQNQIKRNQPIINRKNQQINRLSSEMSRLQNKKNRTIFEEINLFKLKNKINTLQNDIARLQFILPPKILAGTMPIIPAAIIPSGISQVRFIGVQKSGKGGKIVTDLVFRTEKGIMGVARGVSTTVKGNTVSIVGGRFGTVTARLLKGGRRFRKIKTFVGAEKSMVRGVKFTSDKLKQIAKFVQNKKKTGLLRVIKTNIKGMQQAGVGRVATIKGHTFFKPFLRFPSGRLGAKLGKGIDLDDFASISAILTKGDISAIVGKTITLKGRKAEFIGLIKSLSSGSSRVILSGVDKQQYSKALQKLFTTVAAAVSKAERSGKFATKTLTLAAAAAAISKKTPSVSGMRAARTTLVKREIITTKQKISITTTKRKIISKKARVLTAQRKRVLIVQKRKITTRQRQLQRQINKQKQKVKQLSRSKTKQAQKSISRAKQTQRLAQKQLSRLKTQQKLIQTTTTIQRPGVSVPTIRIPHIIPIKLPKGFTKRKISKAQPVFYVKIKRGGKIVNLIPRPLTLRDAKDFLTYKLDKGIIRSGWFEPIGRSKNVIRIPKAIQGYFTRHKRKVRPYRIKLGKKKGIRNGLIEKRRFALDHPQEKATLRRARAKKVAIIPKSVKGYFGKHKKKFRKFRVKKGKRFTLKKTIIERKKYIGDTRSERLALKRARAKSSRRKSRKKKIIKRKSIKKTRITKKRK